MVKQIFTAAWVGMLSLAFTGCSDNENILQPTDAGTGRTTLRVSTAAPSTRTMVDEHYNVVWTMFDSFYAWGNGREALYTLIDGAGTNEGLFEGYSVGGDDDQSLLTYAVFPANMWMDYMTYTFEDTYRYGWPTNPPMWGRLNPSEEVTLFHMLSGLCRFTIENVPAEGEKTVTLRARNGDLIAGDASFVETNGGITLSRITEGSDRVTVIVPDGQPEDGTLKIDIPVPTGVYSKGFELSLSTAGGEMTRLGASDDDDPATINTQDDFEVEDGGIEVMAPLVCCAANAGQDNGTVEVETIDEAIAAIKDGAADVRVKSIDCKEIIQIPVLARDVHLTIGEVRGSEPLKMLHHGESPYTFSLSAPGAAQTRVSFSKPSYNEGSGDGTISSLHIGSFYGAKFILDGGVYGKVTFEVDTELEIGPWTRTGDVLQEKGNLRLRNGAQTGWIDFRTFGTLYVESGMECPIVLGNVDVEYY